MDTMNVGTAARRATRRYLLLLAISLLSCNEQPAPLKAQPSSDGDASRYEGRSLVYPGRREADSAAQVAQYIRRIFQDRAGNIWFGTGGRGVCRYDGVSLVYFSTNEGLSGNDVRSIVEDAAGHLWFATNGGVCRYDGTAFTTFTEKDGLVDDDVFCVYIDRSGSIWFGTGGGVSRYDGRSFTSVPIPAAEVAITAFPTGNHARNLVWSIMEDGRGRIWFGTNGRGVSRYDGRSFISFTEKDGLGSNFVWSITEDRSGKLWFATSNGVSRYDGRSFSTLRVEDGLSSNEVWPVMEDTKGIMWFGTGGGGASRYDGTSFTNFTKKEGLGSPHVQSFLEDRKGRIWFGTSGGVYRFEGTRIINVTRLSGWPEVL